MPTAAQAYLDNLLLQHPPPLPQAQQIAAVIRDLGLPPVANALEFGDRAGDPLKQIHGSLPPVAQQLIQNGALVVGEVGVSTPGVYVNLLGNEQFAIVLHSGLFAFLYRIARPLASAVFRIREDAGGGIDEIHFARVIAEVFWWLDCTGESVGPEYPITAENMRLANILAMRAERFLLAHEIGHVLVAMTPPNPLLGLALDDATEEHMADMLALDISLAACLSAGEEADPTWLMLTYAGAELALQIWGTLERIGHHLSKGVHPPSAERIAWMRNRLRRQCDSDESFEATVMAAKVIERLFNEAGDIICRAKDHSAIYDAEASALIRDFTALLERCSCDPVPDYSTFYIEAPALLGRGYPEDIFNRVIAVVANRFKAVIAQELGAGGNGNDPIKFKQYKLLRGLTDHLPEPVRALYSFALELGPR